MFKKQGQKRPLDTQENNTERRERMRDSIMIHISLVKWNEKIKTKSVTGKGDKKRWPSILLQEKVTIL